MKIISAAIILLMSSPAMSAELPNLITHGKVDRTQDLSLFGTYNDAYYQRRWKRMCASGARYDAMREAYEMDKKENPCK